MATLAVRIYESTHNEKSPIFDELVSDFPPEIYGVTAEDTEDEGEGNWKRQRFAFYFGMAYGLARAEEPFAAEATLIATAMEAARKAGGWGDTAGGRPESES